MVGGGGGGGADTVGGSGADGSRFISPVVRDARQDYSTNGNQVRVYYADTHAPGLTVTSPVDGGVYNSLTTPVTGTVSTGLGDPRQIQGTLVRSDGLRFSLNGQVDAAGNWSATTGFTNTFWSDGVWQMSITATDGAGRVSTVERTVTIDRTLPTIVETGRSFTAGQNGWSLTPVTISFAASDNVGIATDGSCPFPAEQTSSGQGEQWVESPSCTDLAGNVRTGLRARAMVDLDDPEVTSVVQYDGEGPQTVATVTVTVTDAASGPRSLTADEVAVPVLSSAAGVREFELSVDMPDCSQSVALVADDFAGRTSASSLPLVRPVGGIEVVGDGVDQDCDGADAVRFYADSDGDGYGDPAVSTVSQSGAPADHVADSSDCDDSNQAVNPAATEILNGIDDDCDGTTDEGATATTVAYTGAVKGNLNGKKPSIRLAAKIGSQDPSCVGGRAVTFRLTGPAERGPYTVDSNALGDAATTVSMAGWQPGRYTVSVAVEAKGTCAPATTTAVVTVTVPNGRGG